MACLETFVKSGIFALIWVKLGVKYKAALSVAYGAGLRVSEVVSLKVSDIDSKRMMLRVKQGKGGKDRRAMLSPQLLVAAAREQGITPLEVMLEAMHRFYAQDDLEKAGDFATRAAPYMHPAGIFWL